MSCLKRGKSGTSSKAYPIFSRIRGLKGVTNVLYSLRKFSDDERAKERLKIIQFYDKHGEKLTKEAFKAGRKTIFVWKKKLRASRGSISSLVPLSTRPLSMRKMHTNPKIIAFIRKLRSDYGRLGKEAIKPILDKHCKAEGIPGIQESTIGKIIKRNNLFYQKTVRIYHDPSKNYKRANRRERARVKYAPKPQELGYIEMDSIVLFADRIRYYIYSAIDVRGKFAFSLLYKSLNSRNTVDFFKKFERVYPIRITQVQTDNGLEFLGDFEKYLKDKKIPHVFIYPRCCRINGVVERYQKTLQEQFVYNNLDIIHDPVQFNKNLLEYLIFYLTEKIHKSIGKITPMDYLISNYEMSKMSATLTFC